MLFLGKWRQFLESSPGPDRMQRKSELSNMRQQNCLLELIKMGCCFFWRKESCTEHHRAMRHHHHQRGGWGCSNKRPWLADSTFEHWGGGSLTSQIFILRLAFPCGIFCVLWSQRLYQMKVKLECPVTEDREVKTRSSSSKSNRFKSKDTGGVRTKQKVGTVESGNLMVHLSTLILNSGLAVWTGTKKCLRDPLPNAGDNYLRPSIKFSSTNKTLLERAPFHHRTQRKCKKDFTAALWHSILIISTLVE